MDIDRKIHSAEEVLDRYEKLSTNEKSKKTINTKFSIASKHSSIHDLVRRLISLLLPKNIHLVQTNPTTVANRLLKIAKQKNVTNDQRQQLHALYERYKKILNEGNNSQFVQLDQKWQSISKPKEYKPAIAQTFAIHDEWADSGESIEVKIGEVNYLYPKKDIIADQKERVIADLIQKRIEPDHPKNALEYSVDSALSSELHKEVQNAAFGLYQLNDKHILRPYASKTDTTEGFGASNTNTLFSIFFSRNDCTFIDLNGNSMQDSAKDKIAYTCDFLPMDQKEIIQQSVKNFLTFELSKNLQTRPKKIFVPMSWKKNGHYHAVLLVVEPSSKNSTEARITMINTHGDSLSLFREFEEAVLKGAAEVYKSPNTSAIRNTKCIYTTACSCGPDVVELARALMDVENVQATVKKGLPRKSHDDDKNARLEHGEAVYQFLKNYVPEDKLNELIQSYR